MNYTILTGKTINGTLYTHFIVVTDSNGIERNIHKNIISSINLNVTTVTLQGESPLWLIDFTRDDIVTVDGVALTSTTAANKATELRDLLLPKTNNPVSVSTSGINVDTTELNNRIGAKSDPIASAPNVVSSVISMLKLIADRANLVLNNTGSIALYTDTLENRVGDIVESVPANYNASSGLNGLMRLEIKTLTDNLTTLNAKDFATQTSLAALLASFTSKDFATQTTLAAAKTVLDSISSAFTTLNAKDFATQTTLAAAKTVLDNILSDLQNKSDKNETQPVSMAKSPNPVDDYEPSDIDSAGATAYYGFLHASGKWYILKKDATSCRYANGTSNYTSDWTARAGLAYDYFNNLTW